MKTIKEYSLHWRSDSRAYVAIHDGWRPIELRDEEFCTILTVECDDEAEECREEFAFVQPGCDLQELAGEGSLLYLGRVESVSSAGYCYLVVEKPALLDGHFSGRPDSI